MTIRYETYFKLWKVFLSFAIPLALLPLAVQENLKLRCAYVLLLMAFYWLLGLAPDPATALLPIALFPVLGVVSTAKACVSYMKPAVAMMISGLLIAFAIEESNLHKRIALRLLLLIGIGVKRVLLGLMFTTMILSFWISNTATTAMILPVAEAIVNELSQKFNNRDGKRNKKARKNIRDELGLHDPERRSVEKINTFTNVNLVTVTINSDKVTSISIQDANRESIIKMQNETKHVKTIRMAFFLSIAYSANIGGTGTITGTGPNLVLQGIIDNFYPNINDLSFATWMIYAVPGAFILVILSWIFLCIYFLRKYDSNVNQSKLLGIYLQKRYRSLGPITFHETAVLVGFFLIIFLWFFRSPKFIPGWENVLNSGTKINDATPALLILFYMFIIPADFKQFIDNKGDLSKPIKYLLSWRNVNKRMPWGVILLVGGGFSLAEGTINSGLSSWFGEKLSRLEIQSPKLFLGFLLIFSSLITEITSNAATAAVILPVVNQAALSMRINPLYFTIPVTISVSFAFILPVASPSNALVYEYLKIKVSEMIIPGLFMNFMCLSIELILINTWGNVIFNFDEFPQWANEQILLLNTTFSTNQLI